MNAKLTFLGTGTSQGIPIIGCPCDRCQSPDPRDKRLRAAAFVEYGGLQILIDAGPDFRMQMLRAGIRHLDAILLTHNHKDHTGGLDDVRSLNYIDRRAIEIWCEPLVLDTLRREYAYAFAESKYPGAPEWHIHQIDERPFVIYPEKEPRELVWIHDVGYRYQLADGTLVPTGELLAPAEQVEDPLWTGLQKGLRGDGIEIIPIRGYHHDMPVLGFRFGGIAYITDMSRLPETEMAKLQGLEHLTLNTVGYKPHHSHFSLDETLVLADRIGARHTWLTHLSHTFPPHAAFCEELRRKCAERNIRSDVQPAWDGLVITAS
ncbi:MAG: MBL fold metallo-hydrolase [Bacteroidales bacterium]|nr:MBL fold metallo-hydrolase [Bacteroidales bacterium]